MNELLTASLPKTVTAPARSAPLAIDSIRACLEGAVPSVMATCDAEGEPNVSLISQVHYVDGARVALSYQFFNKTRRNILATRTASVAIVDPMTLAQYRLTLDFEETQTSGPLFESMKAKLAGIASHTGMEGVFKLLGADIYKVRTIEPIPGRTLPPPPVTRNLLSAVRRACERLAGCRDLADLFDTALACLEEQFGIQHGMVLMLDATTGRLYTVASRGYPSSGIGSEVAMGEGVIGVAAREGVATRIGHMTSEYGYGAAIRDAALSSGMSGLSSTEIPFPGLRAPHSQIALPIMQGERAIGVLFAESREAMRFWYEDEDALSVVASQLGAMARLAHQQEETPDPDACPEIAPDDPERIMVVRHYHADNSIFLDHDYLIKGVAGAIFWKLLREHAESGRVEFTNRELRLDPLLRLPEHAENLEARLLLLQRRLCERDSCIRIDKCGRGRFRLAVHCKPVLEDICASPARTFAV
jgi:adenylate cyclase